MQTFVTVIFAILVILATAPTTSAQDQPSRIDLVVPFSPGGTTDILARIIARNLSRRGASQFFVRNRPGGAGRIALSALASARPDGSNLAVVSNTLASTIRRQQLEPVAMIGRRDLALFVADSSGIDELTAFRRRPSTPIIVAALTAPAKLAALHTFRHLNVPFRFTRTSSTRESIQRLASRSLDAIIVPPSLATGSPAIKAIAVFSLHQYGSINTAARQGVPVHFATNYGIVGPPNLSAAARQRTSESLEQIIPLPDFRDALQPLDVTPEYQDSQDYRDLLQQVSNPHCDNCGDDCDGDCQVCDHCSS